MNKIQILTEQLCSPDEELRRLAVFGLGAFPFEEIVDHLFRAMGDASWRVRKEAVEKISAASLDAEMIEELIGLLSSQDNAGLRNSAVEVLVRQGVSAIPALQLHVNDPDHDVRKFIIDIMGGIGDTSFVTPLIAALSDPDANVRAAAVENLGKIGDPRAVQPLMDVLVKSDILLKYTILEALAAIGRPVPMTLIFPLAGDPFLRKAVYDCLGSLGGEDAVSILLHGLVDKGKNVREAAGCALEKVRDRLPSGLADQLVDAGLREFKATPIVDELRKSLAAPDIQVRKAFVRILGIIGDERVLADFLSCCSEDRLRSCSLQALKAMKCNVGAFLSDAFSCADSETRCSIAYLCGEMDLAECVPLLVEGINDSLPAVRKASVYACGRLAHPDLIPSMVRGLHDFDPDVRDAAADAFANFAEVDRAAVEQVAEELLSAVDPEHRRHAALLFGALADVEKLSLLMKDDSVEVRKTAVTSLASLKNRECTGHLIMALVDENPDVRIAAASALVETAGSEALEPLLLLLNDDDQWVQCTALRGLGKLKGDQAFCAVEAVFESAKGALMIAAIESLGTIGGDKASTLLEKALNNDDEEVVKTAMEFLAREGDWWVEKHLDALLRHSHWGVRNCFIKVLADLWQGRSVPYLSQALAFEHDDLVRKQIREALGRCL